MNLYKNVERNKDGQAEGLLTKNKIAICQYFMDTEKVNKLHFVRDEIEFSLDPEVHKKIKEVVSKVLIRYREFISSPASVKYHGNYDGGLFDHSLAVYLAAIRLSIEYGIKPSDVNFIACFFHDLCKVGKYIAVPEFKKNYTMVQYEYNPDYDGIEHGAESLRRLLTVETIKDIEEVLPKSWQYAIAYHMGVFGVSNEEMRNFSSMSEKYPEILLLHHADMVATKIYKL